jgi:type VI secretion system protein ImpM
MCSAPVTPASGIGFFGKLPAHGDFIQRGLPRSFIAPWDQWLQAVLANSRELLGGTWLSHYLVGPIWRFALSAGLCGSNAWRGVLMPSVDRVNRYYPLTIAMAEPADTPPLAMLADGETWFAACEEAALGALDPAVDADALLRTLGAIEQRPAPRVRVGCAQQGAGGASAWRFGLTGGTGAGLEAVVAEALLCQAYPQCSLWWTTGSDTIGATLLIHRGLPSMHDFAALLDGRWQRWGWADCAMTTAGPAGDDDDSDSDSHEATAPGGLEP